MKDAGRSHIATKTVCKTEELTRTVTGVELQSTSTVWSGTKIVMQNSFIVHKAHLFCQYNVLNTLFFEVSLHKTRVDDLKSLSRMLQKIFHAIKVQSFTNPHQVLVTFIPG